MARLALTALLATAVVAVLGQEIELGQPYDEEAEERFGPLDYDLLGEGVGGDGSGIVDEDDNASNRTTRSPSNATTSTALISTTVTTATTTTITTTTTASTSATTTTTTSITSTTHTTSTTITKFCHAGQYLNKAENRCEPCLEGTYQDENGDASKGSCKRADMRGYCWGCPIFPPPVVAGVGGRAPLAMPPPSSAGYRLCHYCACVRACVRASVRFPMYDA